MGDGMNIIQCMEASRGQITAFLPAPERREVWMSIRKADSFIWQDIFKGRAWAVSLEYWEDGENKNQSS